MYRHICVWGCGCMLVLISMELEDDDKHLPESL